LQRKNILISIEFCLLSRHIRVASQDALIVEFAGGEQICLMRDDFFEGDLCINVLPPDDILRQYHVEPRREALVLSRQGSESGSADSIAGLTRQMERHAHLGCEDAQNLPALVPPPPIDPSHEIQMLNIHDRVDIRDLKSGKWRPAEVGVFVIVSCHSH
jgi:hypothetical protein